MVRKYKVGIGGEITTRGITGEIVDEIQPNPFARSDSQPATPGPGTAADTSRIRVSVD